jgi:hypothetical protein
MLEDAIIFLTEGFEIKLRDRETVESCLQDMAVRNEYSSLRNAVHCNLEVRSATGVLHRQAINETCGSHGLTAKRLAPPSPFL